MLFSIPFDENSPRRYRTSSFAFSDDLRVVEIGYNRTPKGLRQIMKRDVYILHYITKGSGEFCGKKFTENNGYLVVPNELETVVADETSPYEAYWVMFKGRKALDLLQKCKLPCHNDVFEFARVKECADVLHSALCAEPANDFEEASRMTAALYQVMELHFSQLPISLSVDTVSRKVKKYIDENYVNAITVDSIARSFDFSRNYLYTLFKKEYGISLQEYLLNVRIEKAKELLLNERSLLISEVARAVGYNDALYFSRLFCKKVGVSPSRFIKTHHADKQ